MSHLRRLAIRGYQSIEKANLRLGEITIVIGPTDSGKSAVVRAIRDWAYNAPGASFTTEGCKITRIAVAVGGEHKIVLEKETVGKSKTVKTRYYLVDGQTHEATQFEKVGRSAPNEVMEITGIVPLRIDDITLPIHFAEQGKAWFLLDPDAWNATRVSKVIGRISGVEALLFANRDLVNKRNSISRDVKEAKAAIEEYEREISQLAWVDHAAELVEQAEVVEARLRDNRAKLDLATKLMLRLKQTREREIAATKAVSAQQGVAKFLKTSKLAERVAKLIEVERLLEEWDRLEHALKQADGKVELASGRLEGCASLLADIARDDTLTCPLCGQSAHKECRIQIAKQARAAKKSAR